MGDKVALYVISMISTFSLSKRGIFFFFFFFFKFGNADDLLNKVKLFD